MTVIISCTHRLLGARHERSALASPLEQGERGRRGETLGQFGAYGVRYRRIPLTVTNAGGPYFDNINGAFKTISLSFVCFYCFCFLVFVVVAFNLFYVLEKG